MPADEQARPAPPDRTAAPAPAAASPAALTERAAWRTMRERRRRVVRNVLKVGVLLVLILVLSIVTRNQQDVDGCRRRMEAAARWYQEQVNLGHGVPNVFPPPIDTVDMKRLSEHAFFRYNYVGATPTTVSSSPTIVAVGVCRCRNAHERILQASGRHILVYDSRRDPEHPYGSYRVLWKDEQEFKALEPTLFPAWP